MNKKRILTTGGILIVLAAIAAFCYFRFAGTSYTVSVSVGEHGSVSGMQGDFVLDYSPSVYDDPVMSIIPDDGYMTDRIIIDGEVNEEYTEAAHLTQYYVIEDLEITKDTSIEVSFRELDDPALAGTSNVGYRIKATSEGPGDIVTVYEDNSGFYLSDDEEEDRTITWISDTDNDALVKSVTINGVEDPSYAGKDYGEYVATSGNVDVHIVFEKSDTPLPGNEDDEDYEDYEDEEEGLFKVTTSAGPGGKITDSFDYYEDYGYKQEVIFEPDAGYYIDTVKVNGSYITEPWEIGLGTRTGKYTFYTGDQDIEVTFSTTTFDISDTGKASIQSDKPIINTNEEATVEVTFEPKDTAAASSYAICINDFELVSSDKGVLDYDTITGTIAAGVEKETVTLKIRSTDETINGIITAELFNTEEPPEFDCDVVTDVDTAFAESYLIPDYYQEFYEDYQEFEEADTDNQEYEEEPDSRTTIIIILGIAAVIGLAAAFVIRSSRK